MDNVDNSIFLYALCTKLDIVIYDNYKTTYKLPTYTHARNHDVLSSVVTATIPIQVKKTVPGIQIAFLLP